MKKPVLVIMAAGMGSRYNGLKQIDPIDKNGHIIIDYSIFDAKEAGFEEIVFIIKKQDEEDFKEAIGNRIKKQIKVKYVYQDLNNIPKGFQVPKDRKKPWGTAHAILSAKEKVDGPFVVINADDYYGKEAFKLIYNHLTKNPDDEKYKYAMVGYELENTVTENGYVSRGVCTVDSNNELVDIIERTNIEVKEDKIVFTEDENVEELPKDTVVSMNIWGFNYSFLEELESRFPKFLEKGIKENPQKWEYYPTHVLGELLEEDKASIKVLKTKDKWLGVTYQEDRETVVGGIKKLKEKGIYPQNLWEG